MKSGDICCIFFPSAKNWGISRDNISYQICFIVQNTYIHESFSFMVVISICLHFFYRYLALLHQHTDFQSNILSHQFAQWRALPIRIMSMHFSFFFHCCYKYQPLTHFRMSIISDQARFIDCKMKRVHFQCSIYCLCVCLWIISVFILSQIARSNL